jgi:hypothetical protein
MTKQIRRNAPEGAEYYAILNGEVYYYKIEGEACDVSAWLGGKWKPLPWLDFSEIMRDSDFKLLHFSSWKEWVYSIMFVLAAVTVLGVVNG